MDEITMSMDGVADISGTTWWHKSGNGDHFTVRDVMSDGSQMLFTTTDNRNITSTEMDNYIQSDTPITNKPKINPNMGKINIGNLDEVSAVEVVKNDNVLVDNNSMLAGLVEAAPVVEHQSVSTTNNYSIIDKAFSKVEIPTLELKLNWVSFPKREVELLVDIMSVSTDDIAKYIFEKYFQDDINNIVIKSISETFDTAEK